MFECNNTHCSWKDHVKGQDWDYYSESDGDCPLCQQRCKEDSNCGAIECGDSYCSWWSRGKCTIGWKTVLSYFTCRLPSTGIHK